MCVLHRAALGNRAHDCGVPTQVVSSRSNLEDHHIIPKWGTFYEQLPRTVQKYQLKKTSKRLKTIFRLKAIKGI